MDRALRQRRLVHLSLKFRENIIEVISYIFIILWIYTATDKIFKIDEFIHFMSGVDFIKPFNVIVAWMIPILELLITILLVIPKTKIKGIIASTCLMCVFTLYICYNLFIIDKRPCHCGGVIDTLSWTEHIFFNLFFIMIGVLAILLDHYNRIKR